jgi:hypothetical protein
MTWPNSIISVVGALGVLVLKTTAARADETIDVRLGPITTVVERSGITGAGWASVVRVDGQRGIELIYPNHPDDFGATAGTGCSRSTDDGATWMQAADDRPIAGMVDLWQDRAPDGTLVAFGIRRLPDPKLRAFPEGPDPPADAYVVGRSPDEGRTWDVDDAVIRCPPEAGVIARPLPHLLADRRGIWLMPAYAWSPAGHRALLLESADRGTTWTLRGTPAIVSAIRSAGVAVTTPWLENAVTRTSDGSLLAVIRTGSSEQASLVTTRSSDDGHSWSPVERLLVGDEKRPVAGKLPSLLLLPNGALTLLTAHTKLGCRLYLSTDGTGRSWSEAHVVSTTSGGNTSMVGLDDDALLVFMPSNKRITCRKVELRRNATKD